MLPVQLQTTNHTLLEFIGKTTPQVVNETAHTRIASIGEYVLLYFTSIFTVLKVLATFATMQLSM